MYLWITHVTHTHGKCHPHSHTLWSLMLPTPAKHVVHHVTHTRTPCSPLCYPHPQPMWFIMSPTLAHDMVHTGTNTHVTHGSSCHSPVTKHIDFHVTHIRRTWGSLCHPHPQIMWFFMSCTPTHLWSWSHPHSQNMRFSMSTTNNLYVTHINRTICSSCNPHPQKLWAFMSSNPENMGSWRRPHSQRM